MSRAARRIVASYAGATIALAAVNLVAPQRNGLLALTQILAPHLALPLLLALPFAVRRPRAPTSAAIAIALAVAVARFGPGVVSLPVTPPSNATTVRFLSWNLETGNPRPSEVVTLVGSSDADVVALQELPPDHAATLDGDTALANRFPYRAMFPVVGTSGIGLLSRFPLRGVAHGANPFLVEAAVSLPTGDAVTVINAHPFPARIATVTGLRVPVGYEAADRDTAIRAVRARVDAALQRHEALVVIGDFNVTDREPAYNDLAEGLLDAHREVGQGTGSTWRPDRMTFLPFGVLRIDYVLAGGGVNPTEIEEDCTPRGTDHCVVRAAIAVPSQRRP